MRHRNLQLALLLSGLAYSCKTTPGRNDSAIKADQAVGSTLKFDLNDVSILVASPNLIKDAQGYLRFADKGAEGALLTEAKFDQVLNMLENPRPKKYEDWAMSALRIDNCAKIHISLPCTIQIRLVFQPLDLLKRDDGFKPKFDDQAMHLAFNIDKAKELTFYQDFLKLKESGLPVATEGPLGQHPVLAKEGMNGPFATKMNALVLKYALPSKFDRIAVMTSSSAGSVKVGDWNFAATQEMVNGAIKQTPIPCQSGLTNTFAQPSPSRFTVSPDMVGCADTDITDLNINKVLKSGTEADKKKALDASIRINNPSLTFFASTTCVNCHLASRRADQLAGVGFSVKQDGNPLRYKLPGGTSNTIDESSQTDNTNMWGIRAFGWGEHGKVPGITVFTLNDTIRVASEINEILKANSH